jgi:hypothetical protein
MSWPEAFDRPRMFLERLPAAQEWAVLAGLGRGQLVVAGHLFAYFLAARLGAILRQTLEAAGVAKPWAELVDHLQAIRAVEVEMDNTRCLIKSTCNALTRIVFAAACGQIPPALPTLEVTNFVAF